MYGVTLFFFSTRYLASLNCPKYTDLFVLSPTNLLDERDACDLDLENSTTAFKALSVGLIWILFPYLSDPSTVT
jgi:hypothetical protein